MSPALSAHPFCSRCSLAARLAPVRARPWGRARSGGCVIIAGLRSSQGWTWPPGTFSRLQGMGSHGDILLTRAHTCAHVCKSLQHGCGSGPQQALPWGGPGCGFPGVSGSNAPSCLASGGELVCRGCSIWLSQGACVCKTSGPPLFPPAPGQGLLQSGIAAGLSETAMVLIFLPLA